MPQDRPMMAPIRMPTGGVRMKIPDNPPNAAPSVKPRTNRLYKQSLPDGAPYCAA